MRGRVVALRPQRVGRAVAERRARENVGDAQQRGWVVASCPATEKRARQERKVCVRGLGKLELELELELA